MAEKASHKCVALGCGLVVPASMLMCRNHWGMVTSDSRARVYDTERRGLRLPDPERSYAIQRAVIDAALTEGKHGLILESLQRSNARFEAQRSIEARADRQRAITESMPTFLRPGINEGGTNGNE